MVQDTLIRLWENAAALDAGGAHRHVAAPRLLQSLDRRASPPPDLRRRQRARDASRRRPSFPTRASSRARRRSRSATPSSGCRRASAPRSCSSTSRIASQREAAEIMGVSETAFESMLARARRQLKRRLAPLGQDAKEATMRELDRRLAAYGSDFSRWPDGAAEAREALLAEPDFRRAWEKERELDRTLAAERDALDAEIARSGALARLGRLVCAAHSGRLPCRHPLAARGGRRADRRHARRRARSDAAGPVGRSDRDGARRSARRSRCSMSALR